MLRSGFTVVAGLVLFGVNAGAQETPPPAIAVELKKTVVRDMRYSDPATFVPAVAAVDTGGRCDRKMERPFMGINGWFYSYSYFEGAKPVRTVTVTLDSLSGLLNYTDMRGGLTVSNADMLANIRRGVTTRISLNNLQKQGYLENEVDGKSQQLLFVKPEAFLDAENLGVPRKMIEMIYAECVQK